MHDLRSILPWLGGQRRLVPPAQMLWPGAEITAQVPSASRFSVPAALQLANTLLAMNRLLALEIHSSEGRLTHRLVVPWPLRREVRRVVLAGAPQAVLTMRQPLRPESQPFVLAFGNRAAYPWSPLPTLGSSRAADPLNHLLQALAAVDRGEQAIFQILFRPPLTDWPTIMRQVTTAKLAPSWVTLLFPRSWPAALLDYALSEPEPCVGDDLFRHCEGKRAGRLVEAAVTLGVWGSAETSLEIARGCTLALAAMPSPASTLGPLPMPEVACQAAVDRLVYLRMTDRISADRLVVLSPDELAALWHLPSEATVVEGIAWAVSSDLIAPSAAVAGTAAPFVILGAADRPDGCRPVLLPELDRGGPLLIIGKTGVGKSCFMENLAAQDIAAGRGVAVIDVHGDMTPRILPRIPEDRIPQTAVIDASHPEGAVALNPLALAGRVDVGFLVSLLIAVFSQYFGELRSVGRMEDTMRAVLWALMARPGLSLADVGRLFHDPAFRQRLANAVVNPIVKEYWLQEFARLSPAQQLEPSGVLLNKVRAFLTNDTLRRMLTAPGCLDFRQLLDQSGILVVRPVGLPAAESTLLVSLVLTLLFAAARSRSDLPAERRRSCYLYLDEAQTVTSSALPSILSEGRKFGLVCGGLALQYLDALSAGTRQALLGNAGTFVVFRCGPGDARLLQPVLSPLTATDLENLGRYRAVCKMQREGQTLPPFGLQPPDPLRSGTPQAVQAVMEASRRRYGVTEREQAQERQDGNHGVDAVEDVWEAA